MIPRILLSVLLGVGIGAPVARAGGSVDSPYDPMRTNVFYDLAVLYGDANGDGHVDREEYLSFDVSSLEPSGTVGEDADFRFLGFYMPTMEDVVFYVWTSSRIDDSPLDGDGRYVYEDCSFSYVLTYRNSSVSDPGSSTGWALDRVWSANPEFCNFYRSEDGYFSKFVVHGYDSEATDGLYRIKAERFDVYDGEGNPAGSYSCGDGSELLYTDSIVTEDPVFEYYEENAYEIVGAVDTLLYSTVTEGWHWGIGPTFVPQVSSGGDVKEAREMFYVFFDFADDAFRPEEIRSVTYSAVVFGYTQDHYYGRVGAESGEIYRGGFDDEQSSVTYGGTVYRDSVSEIPGSRTQVTRTVTDDLVTVSSKVYNSVLGSYVTETKGQLKGIVDLSAVDSAFAGEEYAMFREFLEDGDHSGFSWAYGIMDDSWVRTLSDPVDVATYSDPHWEGGLFFQNSVVFRETTSCHSVESVVTLGMTVVQEGREFDISCMNDPLTERDVYLVRSPLPTLSDVVVGSVGQILEEWWWVVLLVGLAVLAILAALFNPVLFVVKFVGKGLLFVVELVIDLVYLVLVWWWLALIRKSRGEEIPPLWIFGK